MSKLIDGVKPAAPSSPSVAIPLSANGLRGQVTGVTRIGARAGIIAAGGVAALVIGIFYGISSGQHKNAAKVSIAPPPQALTTSAPLFDNIPGAVQRAPVASHRPALTRQPASQNAQRPISLVDQAPPQQQGQAAVQNALQTEAAAVPQIAPIAQAAAAAVGNAEDPKAAARSVAAAAAAMRAQAVQAARQHLLDVERAARQAPILVQAASANGGPSGAQPGTADAPAAKSAFGQPAYGSGEAQAPARQNAVSPYEVLAGSVIPATLVTGINSDLPGTIIGQVNGDVYDSKSGEYVLIPKGSKVIGRFDSQVVAGQSRVLVVWQRIIYPDASSIDLGALAGTDAAGYSGLTGKVDDHTGKLFRNALLTSLIGIGGILAQPRTSVTVVAPGTMVAQPSVGSQVASQVATQAGQTVQQATGNTTQQAPTIEVRPGTIFNVVVSHDLVLPGPYKG